ncbi:hypothetical protein [Robinsoniella peoriensis]|uniref:hypothetical protein n=1 Tax=Robinsoniella peoriensis TaxID=180332 RepID=UPI00114D254B|nr:hypothetical protein [Robinsoniella peoriensis]
MKINYKHILSVIVIIVISVILCLFTQKIDYQEYQTNFERIDLILNESVHSKPKKIENDLLNKINILNVEYVEMVKIEMGAGFQKVYKNEYNTLVISKLKDNDKLYEKQILDLKTRNMNLIFDEFHNPIYVNEIGEELIEKGVQKEIIFYEGLNKNQGRLSVYYTVDEKGNVVQQGDRMNELFFKVNNDMIYVQFDFKIKYESMEDMIHSILQN